MLFVFGSDHIFYLLTSIFCKTCTPCPVLLTPLIDHTKPARRSVQGSKPQFSDYLFFIYPIWELHLCSEAAGANVEWVPHTFIYAHSLSATANFCNASLLLSFSTCRIGATVSTCLGLRSRMIPVSLFSVAKQLYIAELFFF